jgi:hypothetical protein
MDQISKKIEIFIETLDNPVPISMYQITNKKNDLGLVIGDISPEEFVKKTGNPDVWIISNDFNFEDILIKGISENKNIVVCIKNDLNNEFLSQIKEYTSRGIITKKDKNTTIDPKKLKIICLINKKILDGITYPYFESLFGPVLELNDF